jgi:hypothetical protein
VDLLGKGTDQCSTIQASDPEALSNSTGNYLRLVASLHKGGAEYVTPSTSSLRSLSQFGTSEPNNARNSG